MIYDIIFMIYHDIMGKMMQEHVASLQLPDLLTARLYHACAAYTVDGAQVELTFIRTRTGAHFRNESSL